jgi:hypothetical protein
MLHCYGGGFGILEEEYKEREKVKHFSFGLILFFATVCDKGRFG